MKLKWFEFRLKCIVKSLINEHCKNVKTYPVKNK